MYQVWKHERILMTLKYHANTYQLDDVWMAMYTWVRSQVFLAAQLDPRAPARAARENWRNFPMPSGVLTWKVLDKLQLDDNKLRLQLKLAGVFNPDLPEHRAQEMEDLEFKCAKGTNLHRLIYMQSWKVDTYDQWMSVIHKEKQGLPVDGVTGKKDGGIQLLPIKDLVAVGLTTQEGDVLAQFRDGHLAKHGLSLGSGKPVNIAPACLHCGGKHTVRPCPTSVAKRDQGTGSAMANAKCTFKPTSGYFRGCECRGTGHTTALHAAAEAKGLRIVAAKTTSRAWAPM
jgi:hypothetical protein